MVDMNFEEKYCGSQLLVSVLLVINSYIKLVEFVVIYSPNQNYIFYL